MSEESEPQALSQDDRDSRRQVDWAVDFGVFVDSYDEPLVALVLAVMLRWMAWPDSIAYTKIRETLTRHSNRSEAVEIVCEHHEGDAVRATFEVKIEIDSDLHRLRAELVSESKLAMVRLFEPVVYGD
jgi:hypothetical protein